MSFASTGRNSYTHFCRIELFLIGIGDFYDHLLSNCTPVDKPHINSRIAKQEQLKSVMTETLHN